MKSSPLQSNFNAGEVSPLLYGRVNVDRYKDALGACLNYVPTIQGGLIRRSGTEFQAGVKDHSKKVRLMPFEFSTDQAYMLEFGHQYIRFYKDNELITLTAKNITGATQANPVVITSAAHGYSNGDRVIIQNVSGMTQLNNREFTVANVAANTFELSGVNGTGFTAYSSGGTVAKIYEIATTYQEADLFKIKYTQSADILYLAHPEFPPKKLSRTGHTSWTLTNITFLDGPYMSMNTDSTVTLTPSAFAVGTGVTLTASSTTGINSGAGFMSSDVGRSIRIRQGSTWGWVVITGWTSSTVVTVTVKETLTSTAAKAAWRLGLWSETTGYPSCVVFHEDRLIFAGCPEAPQRLDGSKTSDYENFAPTDLDATLTSAHAISFTLNSNDVNAIRWMISDEKGLPIGTVAGEWVVKPASSTEALSPTSVSAKRTSSYGSADIQPVQVGKASMFVQRSSRKLREFTYFYDVDGFRAPDMTQLAEHITGRGIIQLAHQKEPHALVWAVREDGVLISMTYERDSDALTVAWARHQLGGYGDAANGAAEVESVAVIPSADGTRDEIWVAVKRYINGQTRRYVEVITKFFEATDDAEEAFFVDAGLAYDNPLTITGATQASPVVITATAHGFSNGDRVRISDVEGMTELNGESFTVANATANTFELSGVNGSAYAPYVTGGEARKLVSTITGLNHLEGQSVAVLGDGAVQPNKTVTNGTITLSPSVATANIGFNYNSDGQMLRLEAGAADGTAMGKTRRIHRVAFLLHRSLGLKIGMSFESLTPLVFRTTSDPLTRGVPLFSGIVSETIDADYDFENNLCWRQDQPLPSTILAVAPQMVTQDR